MGAQQSNERISSCEVTDESKDQELTSNGEGEREIKKSLVVGGFKTRPTTGTSKETCDTPSGQIKDRGGDIPTCL